MVVVVMDGALLRYRVLRSLAVPDEAFLLRQGYGGHGSEGRAKEEGYEGHPSLREGWCGREDSNLYGLPHQLLRLARLPFRHARMRRFAKVLRNARDEKSRAFVRYAAGSSGAVGPWTGSSGEGSSSGADSSAGVSSDRKSTRLNS